MKLRLGTGINHAVVEALFDILDEEFDGGIKKKMENTLVYVLTDQNDEIVDEVIEKLQEKDMTHFVKIFTEPEYVSKEIVLCISNPENDMETIIAKINVEDGNGYKTISAVHFVERMLRIFQNKKIIDVLPARNEAALVEKIIYGIPGVVKNSEIVHMEEKKKNCSFGPDFIYI